jgi:hypothetical protein
MATYTTGNWVSVFYQEVLKGDIRKYNNESNDSDSGGGARDLRMNKNFWNGLLPFFPFATSTREQIGKILVNEDETVDISLMAPTDARPTEIRICTTNKIHSWDISMRAFDDMTSRGFKWIYLLMLDDKGQVWADKFCTDVLDRMHPAIVRRINQQLKNKGTIRGIVNIT